MAILRLVPLGTADEGVLSVLTRSLAGLPPFEEVAVVAAVDPLPAFDAARKQHHSTKLLALLLDATPRGEGDRLLGIADMDLFIPILTFVFGEAQVNGAAAVISPHRLRPQYYGMPPSAPLFYSRVTKVALHEIGHTLGLLHCRRPDCVMRASTNADDVDLKPARYCPSCSRVFGR